MKRGITFLFCFVIAFVVVYAQPIVSPLKESEKEAIRDTHEVIDQTHPMYDSDNLPASGCANYIGKLFIDFPDLKALADRGQVTVVLSKNGKISKIEVSNHSVDISPFKIGETLADMSENITFVSGFSLKNKKNKVNIELGDSELNYNPLVRFKNGSYAILHFSHTTGKLEKVEYLTVNELTKNSIYKNFSAE
ncbi:MAG: hypothetical protein LBM95_04065 [Lactobacillales bacterium]|nr:hypothetical protein [Lactobacillales bacterium]